MIMLLGLIDDEQVNRDSLELLVKGVMDKKNIHVDIDQYSSGEEFLESNKDYDLIFLDIYMGDKTGIDVARKLREHNKHTKIVFVTTSNEFASEAFEVEAYHYLIKPANEEKVAKVLNKLVNETHIVDKLTVFVNRIKEDIYYKDIYYIEVVNRKTVIHTNDGDKETTVSLSELEEMLPDEQFVRPIRYAIVSLDSIKDIPGDELTLKNGASIPVSRNIKDDIKQKYADYKWNKLRKGMR